MVCLIFLNSHLNIVNYTIKMALKNLPLIIYLLFFLWGAECPAGDVVGEDVCYYKTQLDV